MTEAPESATVVDEKAIRFYDGALLRAQRTTLVLAAVAVLGALAWRGWKVALPLLVGAAIGWLNFRWLMKSSFSLSGSKSLPGALSMDPSTSFPRAMDQL